MFRDWYFWAFLTAALMGLGFGLAALNPHQNRFVAVAPFFVAIFPLLVGGSKAMKKQRELG